MKKRLILVSGLFLYSAVAVSVLLTVSFVAGLMWVWAAEGGTIWHGLLATFGCMVMLALVWLDE